MDGQIADKYETAFSVGKSLGIKDMPENFRLEWNVPWEAGTLEARGLDSDGKEIIRSQCVTPSAPAKVILESDRNSLLADGDDVIIINARINDEKGEATVTAFSRRLDGGSLTITYP